MFDVNQLADRFGLSMHQVRDRLTALSPTIDPHLTRGKQNAKILKDSGIAIFDRLVALERSGLALEAAVNLLQDELSERENGAPRTASIDDQPTPNQPLVEELRSRIAYLEGELKSQDDMIRWLRERVEHLEPLALPGPRRGPVSWLAELFRPGAARSVRQPSTEMSGHVGTCKQSAR